MLRGFKAKKCVFLTLDGQPLTNGNRRRKRPAEWTGNDGLGLNKREYLNTLKVLARSAAAEQGWECTDEAVYLCMYIYVGITSAGVSSKKILAERAENKRFAIRTPVLSVFADYVLSALQGIIYKKKQQVVAMQIFREYDKEDSRVEMFFGIPSDWEEVQNDLSKAE